MNAHPKQCRFRIEPLEARNAPSGVGIAVALTSPGASHPADQATVRLEDHRVVTDGSGSSILQASLKITDIKGESKGS